MSCVVLDKEEWDNIVDHAFHGNSGIFTKVRNAKFKELFGDFEELGDKLAIFDAGDEADHLYGLYLEATTGVGQTGLKRPVELAAVALGNLDFRMKVEELRLKESLLGRVYYLCSDRPPE